MNHVIVHSQPGMFYGWPANGGIWQWGSEIAVGFTEAHYLEQADRHSQDLSKQRSGVIARSVDGGKTWALERPDNLPEGYAFGSPAETSAVPTPIDFGHRDLAIRCKDGGFLVSRDRGRTWLGPYSFSGLEVAGTMTSRTDYIAIDSRRCLFLLSMRDPAVRSALADRAFAAFTEDGGLTFRFLNHLMPDEDDYRSVMPSTVRLPDGSLFSALRRRHDSDGSGGECWIDGVVSHDLGATWQLAGRVADTDRPSSRHNGNPPSAVSTPDGRVVVVYGYRAPPFGIRARSTADAGKTWSEEIVLRDDGLTWDLGYPRSVLRSDGAIVTVYYYCTEAMPQQHIAATIWHPDF